MFRNTSSLMTRVLLLIAFLAPRHIQSQELPVTIGKVSLEELKTSPYPFEKGAEATVLFDLATAKMIYDNGFKIEYSRHVRIKIFKSTGYHLANVQIPYGSLDKLLNLKAFGYNLEDDTPEKIVVGKKQFFEEKVDPYHRMIRFTFPNIREGSVIEYSYTIIQNEIWTYHSMRFQRNLPVRYVEYQIGYPEFFKYIFYYSQDDLIRFHQGAQKGYYNGIPVNFNIYQWTGSNLPPFEREPMMPENEDYMLGVDFALISIDYPGGPSYVESPSYYSLTEELLVLNAIGNQLDNSLSFAGQVKKIINQEDPPLKKMEVVYRYVQDQMKWNGYEQVWPSKSLVKARHEGTGTNAEINLILVNMLRTAGISADPVVLSTRDNGPIDTRMAIAGSLNYLICCASIDGVDYLLDATDKFRPAGTLPIKCLNGQGWVLSKNNGRWVKLLSREMYETSESFDLVLNEKKELTGQAVITFSGYDAVNMRQLIHEEGEIGFLLKEAELAGNTVVSNLKIRNLDSLHLPLEIAFDITFNHMIKEVNKILFFKPMISIFGDYVNTWVKDERLYPVDLACPSTEYLYYRIRLPEGYRLEEVPESTRIRMPENDAGFSFGGESNGNFLIVTCDLRVRKTFFTTEEYPLFREFYTRLNKKCNEMVIIKNEP
jgi:hypothetical protein